MSFALAIRNTVSEARQAMLTTTSLIVIATVVLQGGAATHALAYLRIPTGYVMPHMPHAPYLWPTEIFFGHKVCFENIT